MITISIKHDQGTKFGHIWSARFGSDHSALNSHVRVFIIGFSSELHRKQACGSCVEAVLRILALRRKFKPYSWREAVVREDDPALPSRCARAEARLFVCSHVSSASD